MPANKQDQVLMACPRCGHQQLEPRSAFSTNCKECGQHFRVQEILNPVRKVPDRVPRQKRITCFECGAGLDVPVSAESTMCKWCSRYVDLHDYRITSAAAKNFKTKGRLIIEPKGYVFNSESVAGEVVIKGRFHGRLTAEHSLTVHSSAEIKGSLDVAHLIIPAGNHFYWADRLKVGSAEIAGELSGKLHVAGTVTLKSTGRWFGELVCGNMVVEDGAVLVGKLHIGSKPEDGECLLP